MARPRPTLTETELLDWSHDLAAREAALIDTEAAFEQHVAAWERRAGQIVDRKAEGLMDAFALIRRAFPDGFNLRIEPWGPGPGAAVH